MKRDKKKYFGFHSITMLISLSFGRCELGDGVIIYQTN
jgi:hypothetical protein